MTDKKGPVGPKKLSVEELIQQVKAAGLTANDLGLVPKTKIEQVDPPDDRGVHISTIHRQIKKSPHSKGVQEKILQKLRKN